jgi:hypothetical protein
MPTSKHSSHASSKGANKALWVRALFIFLYCVIAYVAAFIVLLIAVVQFISTLMIKKPNEHLLNFSKCLGVYIFEIIYFITFNTDEMPFPFKAWPTDEVAEIEERKERH